MKRRRTAIALRAGLALLLGLITSIAIAWTFSIRHAQPAGTTAWTRYPEGMAGWAAEFFGVSQVAVGDGADAGDQSDFKLEQLSQPYVLAPAIAYAKRRFDADESAYALEEYVIASGWPARCLWYHAQQLRDNGMLHLAADDPGINIHAGEDPEVSGRLCVFPLRPLWTGLAANVAVCGAIWFLLLTIPTFCRALRRRPGQCVKCGYMLKGIAGDTCPECGARQLA